LARWGTRAALAIAGLAMSLTTPGVAPAKTGPEAMEGSEAPELALDRLDGNPFRSRIFKGQVVVLDYWATWCAPCKASLPHIDALTHDKDRVPKGLRVFAINAAESADDVKKFVAANNLTIAAVLDLDKDFGKAYSVKSIPTTVLIGRDNKVRKVFVGYAGKDQDDMLDKKIDELLAEPVPGRPASPDAPASPGNASPGR
jgi:thiol-disulfide isomerase/thioredoxin